MPLYLIERNFAEQLNVLTPDAATAVAQVNADAGIQWLFSFLSADKKKTYCLYEAPNPEAIREAARELAVDVNDAHHDQGLGGPLRTRAVEPTSTVTPRSADTGVNLLGLEELFTRRRRRGSWALRRRSQGHPEEKCQN
jgi:hypothetical protein